VIKYTENEISKTRKVSGRDARHLYRSTSIDAFCSASRQILSLFDVIPQGLCGGTDTSIDT
jgi:hypothetical protein